MAEFKLGRIRFIWKDEWSEATTYYKDDVVRYGGKTFMCVVGHIAQTDFMLDLNDSTPKWQQFADGIGVHCCDEQNWRDDATAASTQATTYEESREKLRDDGCVAGAIHCESSLVHDAVS